jgi:hypothetical protein
VVTIAQTDPIINSIVKYIVSSKDIPVSDMKTIIKATSTSTVFGNSVITIEGVSSDLSKVKVIVNYNPANQEIRLNNF